ncbi:MAG: HAMP domain-containing histidine kinase [Spirochaetales bacterium]|nr:HAMP domain-containing histidine kinase [Spirochaetales bacterium]
MFLKSIKFRVAFLFLILFLSGAVILYSTSYLFLTRALKNDSVNELKFLVLNFWAQYQSGGLKVLSQELIKNKYEGRAFLVRIADRTNTTLYLLYPEIWENFDFNSLRRIKPQGSEGIIQLKAPGYRGTVQIRTVFLPDSNILQVGIGTADKIRVLKHFRDIFILALIPVLILGAAGFFFFALRSLKPLDTVIEAADKIIKTGRINLRIPYKHSGDEISKLIVMFNTMLDSLDSSMDRIKRTLDNVAHDLRTPMARLQGTAEIALSSEQSAEHYRQALQECVENTKSIMTLVNTLMDISEAETGVMNLNKSRIDLSSLIRDVAEFYYYAADEKGINIKTDITMGIYADIDPNRIRQVLANILDNAVKYTPDKGSIKVALHKKRVNSQTSAFISISDTGIGIPEEEIEHIWDRLYRASNTKNIKGLGLGLSLARAIVKAHGGTIEAKNIREGGTLFILSIPV